LALRRCVIPVSGFYHERGGKNDRHTVYLWSVENKPFALAGLWDDEDCLGAAAPLLSCCIVVTNARRFGLRRDHREAPLVLSPRGAEEWLRDEGGASDIDVGPGNVLCAARVWPAEGDAETGLR
jgi:putative SOS response-associated peptidase YedK